MVRMVKGTTGRRGRGHKGCTDNEDEHESAPWEGEEQDDDPRGDLRDLYNEEEDPDADDYDWAAGDDEEED